MQRFFLNHDLKNAQWEHFASTLYPVPICSFSECDIVIKVNRSHLGLCVCSLSRLIDTDAHFSGGHLQFISSEGVIVLLFVFIR